MCLRSLLPLLLLSLPLVRRAVGRADAQTSTAGHPIVCLNMLIGGSRNGRWLTSKQAAALTHKGQTYQLYDLSGKIGKAKGSKASLADSPSGTQRGVRLQGQKADKAVALDADWNAVPRLPRDVYSPQSVAKEIIRSILRQNGMASAPVHLMRVYQVDLNGDGRLETVLEAGTLPENNEGSEPDRKRDYSFIAVYTGKGVRAELKVLKHFFAADAEDRKSGAIRYTLLGIADLNGDGRMEIVVAGAMFEGSSVDVYTFDKTGFQPVLTAKDGA